MKHPLRRQMQALAWSRDDVLEPEHLRAVQEHAAELVADDVRQREQPQWGVRQIDLCLRPGPAGCSLECDALDATLPDGRRLTLPGTAAVVAASVAKDICLDGPVVVWVEVTQGAPRETVRLSPDEYGADVKAEARLIEARLVAGRTAPPQSLIVGRIEPSETGELQVARDVVPPSPAAWQWRPLRRTIDELIDALDRSTRRWLAEASDPDSPPSGLALLELATRLAACRSGLGVLRSLRANPHAHPMTVCCEVTRVAGVLPGVELPPYDHARPAEAITVMWRQMRGALHRIDEPVWRKAPAEPTTSSCGETRVARFDVRSVAASGGNAGVRVVLQVDERASDLPDDWHARGLVKLVREADVERTVRDALGGERLRRIACPPGLPTDAGCSYFELDALPAGDGEPLCLLTPASAAHGVAFDLFTQRRAAPPAADCAAQPNSTLTQNAHDHAR